jgi:hypothetical protein
VPHDLTPNEMLQAAIRRAPLSLAETVFRVGERAARIALTTARHPHESAAETAGYVRSLRRVMSGPPTSPSPLLQERGLRRRLFVLEVGQDALRAGSKAAGGSLNDGYLAALCGALRHYHEQLGLPVASVPVAIPISLRTGDDPAGGNRWAGARLALPVHEEDPVERIRDIRQQILEARHEPATSAMSLVAPVAARLPMWLLTTLFSGIGMGVDIQASNVPGSPEPFYISGARVIKMFPFGPLPGPAAMITLHSYAGTCFIGVNLDPAAITEPDLFMSAFDDGLSDIVALSGPRRRRGSSA